METPSIADRKKYILLRKAEIIGSLGKLYIAANSRDTSIFKTDKDELSDLKVACIMDDFTYNSYASECDLMQLTPNNWEEEIENFKPDLLFIESAWDGKDKLWHRKISYCTEELVGLVSYCRLKTVPVVFWNKEDPIYTDTFMSVAKICDWVFTTDIDCVSKYKSELGHNNVSHLHFAAQPKIHNPIEKYQREDKFCFAGAYYHKYQERCKVFDKFSEVFIGEKGLEIYDRNYDDPKPEYAFPENYNQYIKGVLKSTDIDKAYKGYHYGINMNSVSQSQTMFARRVFELMASNTIVVGNYSRGVKNLFGDLTISTDDIKTLNKNLAAYCTDEMVMRKYKLQGLRKVLKQHLYEDRLNYICKKIFKRSFIKKYEKVNVLGFVETSEQAYYVESQFLNQSYEHKKLYIITDVDYEAMLHDVTIIKPCLAEELQFKKLFEENEYAAVFDSKNYYGKNYLLDLMLTRRYVEADVIGKAAYYKHLVNETVLIAKSKSYTVIDSLKLDRSIFKVKLFSEISLNSLGEMEKIEMEKEQTFFSTDLFNFCENFQDGSCELVDDLTFFDTGLEIEYIQRVAEDIELKKGEKSNRLIKISGVELASRMKPTSKAISMIKTSDSFNVVTSLEEKKNEYANVDNFYTVSDYEEKGILRLKLDVTGSLNVFLACIYYDKNKNKLTPVFVAANRKGEFEIPIAAYFFKLSIRFTGSGSGVIDKLTIGKIFDEAPCFLSRSNVLILTNHYPSLEDLYRNMFVHTRMAGYKKDGKVYDVMRFCQYAKNRYREFDDINVIEGKAVELDNILKSGEIDTVCIHFFDVHMWKVLKQFGDKIRIIVWLHGSEVQPWWRRDYNYTSDEELASAKVESKKRLDFWAEVFGNLDNMDIHFVFVSQWFADSVMEDCQFQLKKEDYTIIHNFVDTDAFNYVEKPVEQRLKILSLRPFASRKYANDLTVKAILDLTKEAWFNELDIKIAGKGVLFEEIVDPLKEYENITLEKSFFTQNEIRIMHKEYGVFMNPTRMDAQGVSRDEAMSSGLVPITSAVTAIPEFVDENSGILVDGEDWQGLVAAIRRLYNDSELFEKLSKGAAQRVRRQSGYEQTVLKEVELIENRGL